MCQRSLCLDHPVFANICTDTAVFNLEGILQKLFQFLETGTCYLEHSGSWGLAPVEVFMCFLSVWWRGCCHSVRRKIIYAVAYLGCSSFGMLNGLPKWFFYPLFNFQNEYPKAVCIVCLRKTFKNNESKRAWFSKNLYGEFISLLLPRWKSWCGLIIYLDACL